MDRVPPCCAAASTTSKRTGRVIYTVRFVRQFCTAITAVAVADGKKTGPETAADRLCFFAERQTSGPRVASVSQYSPPGPRPA